MKWFTLFNEDMRVFIFWWCICWNYSRQHFYTQCFFRVFPQRSHINNLVPICTVPWGADPAWLCVCVCVCVCVCLSMGRAFGPLLRPVFSVCLFHAPPPHTHPT